MGALDGVKVLDLTWGIAGPLGVMLLAEHGADVIKVEPPGGGPNRADPRLRVWDRGRRSIEIDLKEDQGKGKLKSLAATADVLVEAFHPGTMRHLGLDYDSLKEHCPRLIYLSVPAYPVGTRHAVRPGYDALVQARMGLQYEQSGWREGPMFLQDLPSLAASYLVPTGILAALCAREETGRGQHVETSLFQGGMSLTSMLWTHSTHGQNEMQNHMAKHHPPGTSHQRTIYECADGWVQAPAGRPSGGKTVAEILGLPDDLNAGTVHMLSAQGTAVAAVQAREMQAKVNAAYKKFRVDEIVEDFRANGLPVEAIVPMHALLQHPQLLATDSVVQVEDPDIGMTTQLGLTIKLGKTPGRIVGPRPMLGEHTAEVLAEADLAGPIDASHTHRALHPHALSDVRVLDFGRAFAGPFAGMVLASLGADVIKVEAPGAGAIPGAVFNGCQQGKRVITVDVKRAEGARILEQLIETADVIHHNLTKGVAERLGIDQESASKINGEIITCNTFMYGPEGPLAHLGGLDPLGQAAAGMEYEAGPVYEGNTPIWSRFGYGDAANALASVVGVLMALYHRKKVGEGQSLWTSILHATCLWGSGAYVDAAGNPPELPRLNKAQTGTDALYRLYRCQGGWIQLAAVKPEHWDGLCEATGRADLREDARFTSPHDRIRNREALEAELESTFATGTPLAWRRRLDRSGVPGEISVDTQDGETLLFDQELIDLGLVTVTPHPLSGTLRQVGQLILFSDTPGRIEHPPWMPGQHTVEILRELGYEDEEIVLLGKDGVVEFPADAIG